jgi:hypothetical protein
MVWGQRSSLWSRGTVPAHADTLSDLILQNEERNLIWKLIRQRGSLGEQWERAGRGSVLILPPFLLSEDRRAQIQRRGRLVEAAHWISYHSYQWPERERERSKERRDRERDRERERDKQTDETEGDRGGHIFEQGEVLGLVIEWIPNKDDALEWFDDGEICAGQIAGEAKDKEWEPSDGSIGNGLFLHFVDHHRRGHEEAAAESVERVEREICLAYR